MSTLPAAALHRPARLGKWFPDQAAPGWAVTPPRERAEVLRPAFELTTRHAGTRALEPLMRLLGDRLGVRTLTSA